MINPGFIQLTHFIPQPPPRVWLALTDPALHAKWWAAEGNMPMKKNGLNIFWTETAIYRR